MGRSILLWMLGIPISDHHPARSLLALAKLRLATVSDA
jgi:hypothetical protein